MAAEKDKKITYFLGTGRRKTAVARVRILEGKGAITINGRDLLAYCTEEKDRASILGPLNVTDQANRLDVIVKVHGGGITGQADAIKQGIARAIKTMFSPRVEQKIVTRNNVTCIKGFKAERKGIEAPTAPTPPAKPSLAGADANATPSAEDTATGMIKKLRDSGFLTRDSRMKERKKYGLRGARRGTQFSKR